MTATIETALAAHRATRLITTDRITRPWRRRRIEAAYEAAHRTRDGRPDWPLELADKITEAMVADDWERAVRLDPSPPRAAVWLTCPWCAGVWVAGAVTVLDAVGGRWWRVVRSGLAVADLVGLIAGHE